MNKLNDKWQKAYEQNKCSYANCRNDLVVIDQGRPLCQKHFEKQLEIEERKFYEKRP